MEEVVSSNLTRSTNPTKYSTLFDSGAVLSPSSLRMKQDCDIDGTGGDNTFTVLSADASVLFGFRPETPDVTSSNTALGSGGPRAIQLELKLIF